MCAATAAKLDPLIYEFDTAEEEENYTAWLRAKVKKSIEDHRPRIPHDAVMAGIDAIIEKAAAKMARG